MTILTEAVVVDFDASCCYSVTVLAEAVVVVDFDASC